MTDARPARLVFGEDAVSYHRDRPSYPAEVADDVVGWLGGSDRERPFALDVGCGTAKAALLLAERGFGGLGVEPDPAMAAVARDVLRPWPAWAVDEAPWEAWDARPSRLAAAEGEDGADLVLCAQAWHWLDPRHRLPQARRALRRGGWLALWWNRAAWPPGDPLRAELDRCYERWAPPLVTVREPGSKGEPPLADLGQGAWDSLRDAVWYWPLRCTTQRYLALLATQSDHRLLDDTVRSRLFESLAEVVEANGGVIDVPYSTVTWGARKVDDGRP